MLALWIGSRHVDRGIMSLSKWTTDHTGVQIVDKEGRREETRAAGASSRSPPKRLLGRSGVRQEHRVWDLKRWYQEECSQETMEARKRVRVLTFGVNQLYKRGGYIYILQPIGTRWEQRATCIPGLCTMWICLNIVLYQSFGLSTVYKRECPTVTKLLPDQCRFFIFFFLYFIFFNSRFMFSGW